MACRRYDGLDSSDYGRTISKIQIKYGFENLRLFSWSDIEELFNARKEEAAFSYRHFMEEYVEGQDSSLIKAFFCVSKYGSNKVEEKVFCFRVKVSFADNASK